MITKVYLIEKARKLPSGKAAAYYILRWSDTRGQMREESLGRAKKTGGKITAARAEELRGAKEHDLAGGRALRDRPQEFTLSEFVEFHESAESFGRRQTTIGEWRTAITHAIDALGDVRLDRVSAASAGTIRAHMDEKKKSAATIRKTLATLRAMFNNAVKRELIAKNPLNGEKLGPPPARDKRIFEPHEVDEMIEAAPSQWWRTLIRLAYTTGLRKGELLHLRWSDVDLDTSTVRVQARRAGTHVEGDDAAPVLAWEPKTAKSTRTVPMAPEAVAALLRLQVQSDGSPYLFLSRQRLRTLVLRFGDAAITSSRLVTDTNKKFDKIQDAAATELRKQAEKAEQDPPAWCRGCFHDLRKSFGTRAAAAGVPMVELQAHMGHSTIVTTATYYTDVIESAADRLRDVFEAA
ncbi:MAG: site-specific integrase [Planctomycetes bacterium]|nr:site-specific integrase [Planctomycetota bacterium]